MASNFCSKLFFAAFVVSKGALLNRDQAEGLKTGALRGAEREKAKIKKLFSLPLKLSL